MKYVELTANEREILGLIRSSSDPSRVLRMFVDIIQRLKSGESKESIAASYGLDWEEVTKDDRCSL